MWEVRNNCEHLSKKRWKLMKSSMNYYLGQAKLIIRFPFQSFQNSMREGGHFHFSLWLKSWENSSKSLIYTIMKYLWGANCHTMKNLWYLQKHAGRNGNLIINFAWPNSSFISFLNLWWNLRVIQFYYSYILGLFILEQLKYAFFKVQGMYSTVVYDYSNKPSKIKWIKSWAHRKTHQMPF